MARERPRGHVTHHTLFDAKKALSEIERLKSEKRQLVAAYRQSQIERVIDLEIVAGTKKEKDREQESLDMMMDSRAYTLEALEYMRKMMVAILSKRNEPSESTDQKDPQRDYIQ